jgi:hypothetical protein
MRILTIALVAGLLAAPALAQTPAGAPPSDAVKIALEKGLLIDIMGMPVDMAFNSKDGSVAAMQGQYPGKYRVDGKKICLSFDAMPEESCLDIPDGTKSGDAFKVEFGQLGEADAKIQ